MCIEEQRDGLSRCTLSVEDHYFNSAGLANLEACVYVGEILVAKANGAFAVFRRKC
jgi:hypothetical protein